MNLTEAKQSSFTKCKPVNEVLRVLKKLHIQLTKTKKTNRNTIFLSKFSLKTQLHQISQFLKDTVIIITVKIGIDATS